MASDEDATIEPRGRKLIATGISIAIPDGFYGRLATRSSIALKLGLHVGAGVIDSDYRGEIKILMFNHTIRPAFITKGEKIAQIIIERLHQISPVAWELTKESLIYYNT